MTTTAQAVAPDPRLVYCNTNIVHFLARPPRANTPNDDNSKRLASLQALTTGAGNGSLICVTASIALVEEFDIFKHRAAVIREYRGGNLRWSGRTPQVHNSSLSQRERGQAISHARRGFNSGIVRRSDPPQGWDAIARNLEAISERSDLSWPDALHLAMAIALRCDILLTDDKQFHDEVTVGLSPVGRLHKRLVATLKATSLSPANLFTSPLIEVLLLRDSTTPTRL